MERNTEDLYQVVAMNRVTRAMSHTSELVTWEKSETLYREYADKYMEDCEILVLHSGQQDSRPGLHFCRFCDNATVDADLTHDGDFSSLFIGHTEKGYYMHLNTGAKRPTSISVSRWSEELGRAENVAVYDMKFCPECGRPLVENKLRFQEEKESRLRVRDLSPEQLAELKVWHQMSPLAEPCYEAPEDIPDEVIFHIYEGETFSNDDFACTAGK